MTEGKTGTRDARRLALALWLLLRLPLVLGLLLLYRQELAAALFRRFGLGWPTEMAVVLLSTLRERALLFIASFALLGVGWLICSRALHNPLHRGAVFAGAAFAVFASGFRLSDGASSGADVAVAATLATLLFLDLRWTPAGARPSRSADVFFGAIVGSGLLLPGRLLAWASTRLGLGLRAVALPGIATTSLLAVLFLDGSSWASPIPNYPHGLAPLQRVLYSDASVTRFAEGDFDLIELARDGRTLFAIGHGFPRLQAFDVTALDRPPRRASVSSGGAASFAYDEDQNEVYVYKHRTREVLVLDGDTLDPRRSFSLRGMAPGDATVRWHAPSRELYVLSEADGPGRFAFAVIDGATGEIRRRLNIAAGSGGIFDPTRPRMYLAFFRNQSEIMVYDTEKQSMVASLPADHRIDGMAFDAESDQLLVGSPLRAAVLRYDASSLERISDLAVSFGVRSLAVDQERRLLLCANLASNALEVIHLDTGRRLARYWLGPWLRKIWLDPDRGVAYVSSKFGLYRVQYVDRLGSF